MTPKVTAVIDLQALVAGDVLVGDQRRGTGDVGLDPGRRRARSSTMSADGLDGLVGQRLALVAGQVDLHVGGLAVGALRARPRSAGRPRSPGRARRAWCRRRASRPARRSSGGRRRRGAGRPPARSSPSCRSRTPGTSCRSRFIAIDRRGVRRGPSTPSAPGRPPRAAARRCWCTTVSARSSPG